MRNLAEEEWDLWGASMAIKDPWFVEELGKCFNSIHGPGSWESNPWLWLATLQLKEQANNERNEL